MQFLILSGIYIMKDKPSIKYVLSFNEPVNAVRNLQRVGPFRQIVLALFAALLFAGTTACEDAMVDMDTYSSIRGVVLDDTTGAAIAGASVTTTPATEAVLTNNNGEFRIEDIPTGDYAIIVRKWRYERRTVNIAVRENRISQATITLSPQIEKDEPRTESSVSITNWWNNSAEDSDIVTVNVEYRITNSGTARISSYSVLFEIESPRGIFSHQEEGTNLEAGQTRPGSFSVEIPAEEATRVVVADTWTSGQGTAQEQ